MERYGTRNIDAFLGPSGASDTTVTNYWKLTLAFVLACSSLLSCQDSRANRTSLDQQPGERVTGPASDPCSRPKEGCPCLEEGETVDCGAVKEQRGDYLICSRGARQCTDGVWGECVAESLTNVLTPRSAQLSQASRLTALGSNASCNNLCDPECNTLADTPTGVAVPSGLVTSAAGLTLVSGSSGGTCSDVTVTPASSVVTVTSIASNGAVTASPASVAFTATCSGGLVVQPNWILDGYDRAVVDASGVLRVFSGIAGQVQVTGQTASDSDRATVTVKVQVGGSLVAVGATADPGKTLYPYKNTVFPLDLPAPLVQIGRAHV